MTGQTVGEVVESRSPRLRPGDVVLAASGWQEFGVAPAHSLRRVDPSVAPISTALHVLGMTGLTAYFGLFDVGRPVAGDTVVVSAAAGAVGQIVGQLALLAGCRTVGIAGSPEKVDDLLTLYNYDVAINYKDEEVAGVLDRECRQGVDVYFDNVGGDISAAVYPRLAMHGRVVICGQIAEYNQSPPHGGPGSLRFTIVSRARVEGFLVTDYAHLYEPALARLAALVERWPPPLSRRRCRRPRKSASRVHRPASRREPRQAPRQSRGAVTFDGTQFQNAVYLTGTTEWPISYADWEARAESAIEPPAFGYIAGGAGTELTIRANREAFERRRLRPRMLAGIRERDLSTEVVGTRSSAPFLLAPMGVLSIAHPEGELAVARAAAATGVPFILSSAASHSIEEIADAMGDAPRWFQLYWINDREVALSFVHRAAAVGYGAVVVTLDLPILGWRPRDLKNAYLPFVSGEGCAQFFTDPVFRERLQRPPEEDPQSAALMMLATFPNLGLSWDELIWLRERVALPLLVKGVLTAEDAQPRQGLRCRRSHRLEPRRSPGRRLDRRARRFRRGRAALGPEATVLVDGGVRTGADVLKAMALGADAVLVGRPYAFALAVGGRPGVEAVIRQLLAETDITLALIGGRAARELDPSFLA